MSPLSDPARGAIRIYPSRYPRRPDRYSTSLPVRIQCSQGPPMLSPQPLTKGQDARQGPARVGIVVIGRNEGERLVRCLRSVVGRAENIVYVDSGSSDGSVE